MKLRSAVLVAGLALCGGAVQASASTLSFADVQFPGTGVPLSVTGSDGTIFTFTAGPASQFEAFQSGGIGSFPAGQFFLSPGLGNVTPINVSLSAPVTSISLPVSSDRVGDSPFTSTVQFSDGATSVDTITQSGNTLTSPSIFNYGGEVTSFIISTSVASAPFGYTQNIGAISYNVSSVPLPASAPMFGAAVVALGLAGYGVKRKKAAATA